MHLNVEKTITKREEKKLFVFNSATKSIVNISRKVTHREKGKND